MGHLFSLASDSTGLSILEIDYTLNDQLQVIDIHPKIVLTLPLDYVKVTDYFMQEYTIFNAPTYEEAKNLSIQFYNFFKEKMETYPIVSTKSDFLHHTLDICKIVQDQRVFDQNYIAQSVLKSYVVKNRTDIIDYRALEFSPLYETNKDDSLVGYYFFHKFMGSYRDVLDTNVVLVEFSPYYQVDKIFQLTELLNHIQPTKNEHVNSSNSHQFLFCYFPIRNFSNRFDRTNPSRKCSDSMGNKEFHLSRR